jgi:hypothetical protein
MAKLDNCQIIAVPGKCAAKSLAGDFWHSQEGNKKAIPFGMALYVCLLLNSLLAATSLVAAVVALVAGSAAYHDVSTLVAGRRITLHLLCYGVLY